MLAVKNTKFPILHSQSTSTLSSLNILPDITCVLPLKKMPLIRQSYY